MALKGLTVNTDPAETAHILAEDDAAIFQSIFGEDGVFNIGQKLNATVISNNKVRVADGVLCVGGHIARTIYGDYSDMTIENGVSGKNRNDLIVAVFSTTGQGGIDTLQLSVKKGVAGATGTDPAVTKGNLYAGSKLREIPLWRIKIEGISIVKIEQMFKVIPTVPELENALDEIDKKLVSSTNIINSLSNKLNNLTVKMVQKYYKEISTTLAHGTEGTLVRYTCPQTGLYHFGGFIRFGASSTGLRMVDIRTGLGILYQVAPSPAGTTVVNIGNIAMLSKDVTYDLIVKHGAGKNLEITGAYIISHINVS